MKELILLALDETPTRQLLSRALRALDYQTAIVSDYAGIEKLMQESSPALVILETSFHEESSLVLTRKLLEQYPTLPIVFLAGGQSRKTVQEALRAGISAYLEPPIRTDEIIDAVQSSLERARKMGDWLRQKINQSTTSLEKRLSELDVLLKLSKEITSSLDIDDVLQQVVSAAVDLTKAEEGSLLLLDEETQQLYMRAGQNFEKGFIDSFRVAVNDSLAGQVILSGEALTYNKDETHKIQTAYLVQALIYVPLKIHGKIIGVLGVDNRLHQMPFSNRDTLLLAILAENAAIAIENARLFHSANEERLKFEAVLSNMKDALLMLDQQFRIQIINTSMALALDVQPDEVIGRHIKDIIHPGDLLNLIERKGDLPLLHYEVRLENERVFSAQQTQIPGVGVAITMQDISYLKELNRLKDDFVHTVSHDLRSPLTAVLGYTELLERVGPLNGIQKDFVLRIRASVDDITALINDLLDLGRIEAGFDIERETVKLSEIIGYTIQNFEGLYKQKDQTIEVALAPNLPPIHGNPLRLRQMCDNLFANAIKYTDQGKKICVEMHSEGNELILKISDEGQGIPREDQSRIFEKFFRASNVISSKSGSGLGLAIVKTIVESHQGRIWVESKIGEGSTFFVVLPTIKQEN